jgi:hypothetical protein
MVKLEEYEKKIKKASNVGGILEVSGKLHFGHLILKITQIIRFWCLNFFQIQFWYKKFIFVIF